MLNSILGTELTLTSFLICMGVSLLLGVGTALVAGYRSRSTQSLAVTLAILPAVVQAVIMLVNGSIGAGIAVAGAFSLVRFRSAPGTAREIAAIFLAMAIGLATGMGYVGLAALLFLILAGAMLALTALRFGQKEDAGRILKITIPEDLDYDGLFDDLFERYTTAHTLEKVKTTNMGTLYELRYRITLRQEPVPKVFLDELRCRNGNLNITCCREESHESLYTAQNIPLSVLGRGLCFRGQPGSFMR